MSYLDRLITPWLANGYDYIIFGEGPATATPASVTLNGPELNDAIRWTAVEGGPDGNAITVAYVLPGEANPTLSASVVGTAITILLETPNGVDVAGQVDAIVAAVAGGAGTFAAVAALVTAELDLSADPDQDGSNAATPVAATALTGGTITGIGTAPTGALYVDTEATGDGSASAVWQNVGTPAAPVWERLATDGAALRALITAIAEAEATGAADAAKADLLGSTVGATPGTASAGVSTQAARADHVHPLPTLASLGLHAVRAAADEARATTTATADPELSFEAVAGGVYIIDVVLQMQGSTGADVKVGIFGPGDMTVEAALTGPNLALADGGLPSTGLLYPAISAPNVTTDVGTAGASQTSPVHIRGTVVTPTAGTVSVGWGQRAATGTTTRLDGSFLTARKI